MVNSCLEPYIVHLAYMLNYETFSALRTACVTKDHPYDNVLRPFKERGKILEELNYK
jgi:hypothetical protein